MEKITLQKKIGKRIKDLREQRGITQQELAANCDFEKSNMSRLEAGGTNPTIYTIQKICTELKVSLTEFFRGIE